jgi:hypothetical protein
MKRVIAALVVAAGITAGTVGPAFGNPPPPTNGGNGAGSSGQCTGNPDDRPATCHGVTQGFEVRPEMGSARNRAAPQLVRHNPRRRMNPAQRAGRLAGTRSRAGPGGGAGPWAGPGGH